MKIFQSPAHKHRVYALLLERIDCGPFDGGCMVFALALQKIHGGEIHVVEGRRHAAANSMPGPVYQGAARAQHAVLKLPDGRFLDANGPSDESQMLARVAQESGFATSADRIRRWRTGDLPDAPHTPALVEDLVQALMTYPSPRTKKTPTSVPIGLRMFP